VVSEIVVWELIMVDVSFDLFTHFKPVISKGNWLDIPIRYAPYKSNIDWIKKLLKWMP